MKSGMKMFCNFALMTLGAAVYALGVALFIDPSSLAPGGVSGIAIIVSRFVPVGTGALVLIFNVPLLIIGFIKFGRRFLLQTVYATVVSSVLIDVFLLLPPLTHDVLLAAVCGGAVCGAGMGLVFRSGGTTGGTDIVVKLLRSRFRHLKTGAIMLIVDAGIVAASAIVFKNIDLGLYAALSLCVSSAVIDIVLYGRDGAKLVYVISDSPDKIGSRLLSELDLGLTYVSGEGAFSGKAKKVLLVAVKKQTFYKMRDIVRGEDPAAFMIVSSATEIFGEGFKGHNDEEL